MLHTPLRLSFLCKMGTVRIPICIKFGMLPGAYKHSVIINYHSLQSLMTLKHGPQPDSRC